MDRRTFIGEFDAQQTAFSSNRSDVWSVYQPLSYISLDLFRIRDHRVLLDRLECCQYGRHRKHSAAKCCAEIVFLDMRRDLIVYQTSTDRNAAAKRFS